MQSDLDVFISPEYAVCCSLPTLLLRSNKKNNESVQQTKPSGVQQTNPWLNGGSVNRL